MKAWLARMAYAEMITPSTRVCGEASISGMSLQVPGSDSSALTTRYFGLGLSCGMKPQFLVRTGVRRGAPELLEGSTILRLLLLLVRFVVGDGRRRSGPAALVGDVQAQQRRRTRRGTLVGLAVREAGEHALRLPPAPDPRPPGGLYLFAGAQPVDHRTRRLRGHVVEELPVDHHHRRVVARRVALDVLQGDLAVLGGLVVADPQVVLEPGEHLVAAQDGAQRGGADADVVLPHRSPLVHRVEGRNAADVGRAQIENRRAGLDAGRRDAALDALHQVQHRQQRGPGLRIAGGDGPQLLPGLLGDLRGRRVVQAGFVEVGGEVAVVADVAGGEALRLLAARTVAVGVPARRRRRLDELTHDAPWVGEEQNRARRRPVRPVRSVDGPGGSASLRARMVATERSGRALLSGPSICDGGSTVDTAHHGI